MALRLDDTLRNQRASDTAVHFANATLRIYSGAQPADPDSAPSGTLLAEMTGLNFSVAGAVISKSGTWQDPSANASGTAGWFRITDSLGTSNFDGAVTGTGGGGEMELDTTSIVAGGVVTVTSFTWTEPAS